MKIETKKKLVNMAKDAIKHMPDINFRIALEELKEEQITSLQPCGYCANWHCDDLLYEIGYCAIYGRHNITHETVCNPPCTKFERRTE